MTRFAASRTPGGSCERKKTGPAAGNSRTRAGNRPVRGRRGIAEERGRRPRGTGIWRANQAGGVCRASRGHNTHRPAPARTSTNFAVRETAGKSGRALRVAKVLQRDPIDPTRERGPTGIQTFPGLRVGLVSAALNLAEMRRAASDRDGIGGFRGNRGGLLGSQLILSRAELALAVSTRHLPSKMLDRDSQAPAAHRAVLIESRHGRHAR